MCLPGDEKLISECALKFLVIVYVGFQVPITWAGSNACRRHNVFPETRFTPRRSSMGGEVALRQCRDAQYPEIFSMSHLSAEYANIAGFIKIGGKWGQLYCGKYFDDWIDRKIHVCRERRHAPKSRLPLTGKVGC
jgi:hypothetical protein